MGCKWIIVSWHTHNKDVLATAAQILFAGPWKHQKCAIVGWSGESLSSIDALYHLLFGPIIWHICQIPISWELVMRKTSCGFALTDELGGRNASDNAPRNSAVICYFLRIPTISTSLDPLTFIVQDEPGTMLMPVWSQLMTSCGDISSISTTASASMINCSFTASVLATVSFAIELPLLDKIN